MGICQNFLYIVFVSLTFVRSHRGIIGVWEPGTGDPYSDVRNVCGNITLACSQWRNDTVYDNMDSCCIPCECSGDCLASGMCCPDYKIPGTTTHRSDVGGESVYYTRNNERCTSTEIVLNPHRYTVKVQEYLLVHSCESVNTSSEFRERCENPSQHDFLDMKPVYSPSTRLNYRNIFCALWNEQIESSLIPWKDTAVCDNILSFTDLFSRVELSDNTTFIGFLSNRTTCTFFWTPPTDKSVAGKACVSRSSVISECTGRMYSPTLDDLCREFDQIPVRSPDKIYRNIFCVACSKDISMTANAPNLSCSDAKKERRFPGIQVYMNIEAFINTDDTGPLLESPFLCNRGEVYITVSRISKQQLVPQTQRP